MALSVGPIPGPSDNGGGRSLRGSFTARARSEGVGGRRGGVEVWERSLAEPPRVTILVVVANIERSVLFKAEVEKGSSGTVHVRG